MTSVTFETALLADALKRAEAVAPRARAGDHAFGTAAGIMMEVDPASSAEPVRIRSTNLEVFCDQWPAVLGIEGPAVTWRIPVSKFTGVVGALPIGTGRAVTLSDETGLLTLQSGRSTKGRVHLIEPRGYPDWVPYDDSASQVVRGFGEMLDRVAWACDKDMVPLTGVLLTPNYMMAANRLRAALVTMELPMVTEPVTISMKLLAPIIRNAGDVRVGLNGNHLTITPDVSTQIKCVRYDTNIPSPKFIGATYESSVVMDRDLLVQTVQRMMNIGKGGDEIPVVRMLLGEGQMALRMEGADEGEFIEEVIGLDGQGSHAPVILRFVPKTLIESVNKAPDTKIQISYNIINNITAPVRLDGGDGYMSWFVQWRGSSTPKES